MVNELIDKGWVEVFENFNYKCVLLFWLLDVGECF